MDALNKLMVELADVEPKRVVHAGFEKTSRLEPVSRGERRKKRRESTETGAKELDIEDKLTVDAIRLRETLDPSRFYKKKSTDKVSKNFQIGTIIEHPIDFYSSRATRKERKQTMVDELIEDAEFKKNVKKRYRRLRATNAIKQKEKALADRRKLLQGKKKQSKQGKV